MEDINHLEFLFRLGFGLILFVIVAWVSSLAGRYFGSTKNRAKEGAWLGFLFGPLGWILVLLMPTKPENKIEENKQKIKNNTTITGI